MQNMYGLTEVAVDQLPCRAYMVMTHYILEVKLEGLVTNRNLTGICKNVKSIITDILWQDAHPRKKRQIGDMLYGWLNKATKNRNEAISMLRKRAFSKDAYLQKHIREEGGVIKKLRDDYTRLSQQPGTMPCSCSLTALNQSGCQCGGK